MVDEHPKESAIKAFLPREKSILAWCFQSEIQGIATLTLRPVVTGDDLKIEHAWRSTLDSVKM